jgi:hypothetical protein
MTVSVNTSQGLWRVSPTLLRAAAPVAPVAKRAESAIMADILNCYCELSPENLSCDGELSRTQTVNRARAIRVRLVNLFGEMGRHVTEDAAFAWSDTVAMA